MARLNVWLFYLPIDIFAIDFHGSANDKMTQLAAVSCDVSD